MNHRTDRKFHEHSKFDLRLAFVATCGCIGSLAVSMYLVMSPKPIDASVNDTPVRQVERIEEVDVLIPIVNLRPGQKVEKRQFRTERRPKNLVPVNAIISIEELTNSYALVEVPVGEPVTRVQLSNVRPISQISSLIPEGFRAVTISTNETSSVEGWARAGAFIDLAWTTRFNGQDTIKIIAPHSKVLSAERTTQNGQAPAEAVAVPTTITLLVSPLEAMKIHLAQKTGTLNLILRGDKDHVPGLGMEGSTTAEDLLKGGIADETGNLQPTGTLRIKNKDGSYQHYDLPGGKLTR